MSALEIRPTVEADLPAITEIYEHAVLHGTATFELIPPDLAEMTRRFRALADGGYPYFVATLDGEVIYGNIGSEERLDFTVVGTAVVREVVVGGVRELVGRNVYDLTHPQDRSLDQAKAAQVLGGAARLRGP